MGNYGTIDPEQMTSTMKRLIDAQQKYQRTQDHLQTKTFQKISGMGLKILADQVMIIYKHTKKRDLRPHWAYIEAIKYINQEVPASQKVCLEYEIETVPDGTYYVTKVKAIDANAVIQDPSSKTIVEWVQGSKVTEEAKDFIKNLADPGQFLEDLKNGITLEEKLKNLRYDKNYVDEVNKIIDEILQQKQTSAKPNQADEQEVQMAELPSEEIPQINEKIDKLQDVAPYEPETNVALAYRTSFSVDDLTPQQQEIAQLLWTSQQNTLQIYQNMQKQLYQFIQQRPPIPPVQGPEETGIRVSYQNDQLKKLDGKETELNEIGLASIFKGLLKCVPELSSFYELALADGMTNDKVYQIMLLFGSFYGKEQGVSPGNLALFANPLVADGYYWGLVISTDNRKPTEVLFDNGGTYKLLKGNLGEVVRSWSATPCKLFIEQSNFGKFWGPQMVKLRKLLSAWWGGFSIYDFIKLVTENTRFYSESEEGFLEKIENELYFIEKTTPFYPGSIVFTEQNDIGVIVSDGRIVGIKESLTPRFISFEEFMPVSIWYPHV